MIDVKMAVLSPRLSMDVRTLTFGRESTAIACSTLAVRMTRCARVSALARGIGVAPVAIERIKNFAQHSPLPSSGLMNRDEAEVAFKQTVQTNRPIGLPSSGNPERG